MSISIEPPGENNIASCLPDFDPTHFFADMEYFFNAREGRPKLFDPCYTQQLQDIATHNANPEHRAKAMELLLFRTG